MNNHAQILNEHTATLAQHGKVVAVALKPKREARPHQIPPDDERCAGKLKTDSKFPLRCKLKAREGGLCNLHDEAFEWPTLNNRELFDNGHPF